MTQESMENLKSAFKNPEFLEKFSLLKDHEEALKLLSDYDVEATEEDLDDIVDSMDKAINIMEKSEDSDDDMLSEEELDTVSGGTIPPAVIIAGIQAAVPLVTKGIKSIVNLFKKKKKKKK